MQKVEPYNSLFTPPILSRAQKAISKSSVPSTFYTQYRVVKQQKFSSYFPSDRALLRVILTNQQQVATPQQVKGGYMQVYLENNYTSKVANSGIQTINPKPQVQHETFTYPRVETSHKPKNRESPQDQNKQNRESPQDRNKSQARTQPQKSQLFEEEERPRSIFLRKISLLSLKKTQQQESSGYRIRKIVIDKSMLRLITAKSFVIMCELTKSIVYSRKSRRQREIASLTKIMTCFIACQIIKSKQLDPGTIKCIVSKKASKITGTTATLRQGDEMNLLDLIHGTMLPSGNDAAYAVADFFGKLIKQQEGEQMNSVVQFTMEMNKYAKDLDLSSTHFANPHGLSNSENYSSAYDQAILINEAMKNELFVTIVGTKQYKCTVYNSRLEQNRDIIWDNTNKLLNRKDCLGVKTGFTPVAGSCLAANFHFSNIQLIIVLLNSAGVEERFTEMIHLYEYTKRKLML